MPNPLPIDDDAAWRDVAANWQLRADTTYLNHGSFGPPPKAVRDARQLWIDRLDQQPMDFFVRQFEPAWLESREKLARFIGTSAENLVLVENATAGMNVVADSFPLAAGDEVILTDHEYGAVFRIWQRACERACAKLITAVLPWPFQTVEETVDAIFQAVTKRTKIIVVSHITSATAVTLPVEAICQRAREAGIAIAVDGPHAVAQLTLATDDLGCDFYAASCHKWLCAPFGTGYLYVAPQWQSSVRVPQMSWGRVSPTPLESWSDEFIWSGTHDPSAMLSIPAAIDFLESIGIDAFRARTHWLAQYARRRLTELTGLEPMVPDETAWYGCMAHAPLPAPAANAVSPQHDLIADLTAARSMQRALWQHFQIEVPVVEFRNRRFIRVSCHLYNDTAQIDRLMRALGDLLQSGY